MNKNYSYKNLTDKYSLLTERYFMEVTKDKLKPECWNMEANHPIAECLNEDGSIKEECWATQPGTTSAPATADYAQPQAGGELGESKHKEHCLVLLGHLKNLEECTNKWMEECSHPASPAVLEAVQRLKEFVNECSY